MVSRYGELLRFERPVDWTDVCGMLQGVEVAMQATIGSMIGQAVASFPKQSLDEWILDYPLQTIVSTIHLILTHEINELFEAGPEEPTRERQADTRDLVVATASS